MHAQSKEQDEAIGGRWRSGLGSGTSSLFFCGSTGLASRSIYVFMVPVFLSSVVWGVSPTTCGAALFMRCNPRLLRTADTLLTFIVGHSV